MPRRAVPLATAARVGAAAGVACALAAPASCRRRAPGDGDAATTTLAALPPASPLAPALTDGAAAPPAIPPPPPETWCARALPPADARAVDPRAATVALAHVNPPCAVHRDHLAFGAEGSAVAIARGRIYLHPPRAAASAWTETPFCTDLGGEPWALRPTQRGAGWTVVGRRFRESEAALLVTDDTAGVTGWNARRGFRSDTRAIVLEGDGSHLGLTARGDVWFVDTVREVAGGLLAALDAQFASATRTSSGTALARDTDATHREIVTGTTVRVPFARRTYARPAGAATRAVFLAHYDQLIAVTDRGVEWSPGNGAPFVSVARWPAPLATEGSTAASATTDPARDASTPDARSSFDADPADTSLGWRPNGAPLLVNRGALATTDCASDAHISLSSDAGLRR